jgi:hypothetical protein
MNDTLASYLRSIRTTTQEDVDQATHKRAAFDLSASDRLTNVTRPHATYESARH